MIRINLLNDCRSPTKRIPLTQGQWAIVDAEDYEELMRFKWYAQWSPRTRSFYAVRSTWQPSGKNIPTKMHRQILGLPPGNVPVPDHINHDTLDNRRANLRITTSRGNQGNRRDQSRFGIGIYQRPQTRTKPFAARVYWNGKEYCLGYFTTPEEAREARLKWLQEKENNVSVA